MKRTEFNYGEFLYGIPSSKESEKYNPENQRVFIHNGYINGDGYGKLIGWHDGKICKSNGFKNFMWGDKVRKSTTKEIEEFMQQLHNQEIVKNY